MNIVLAVLQQVNVSQPGADPGIKQGGRMASAGARAYNGGLGAEPPAGSRGRAPAQVVRGAKPPETEKLLVFDPKGEPTFSHFSGISW